MWSAVLLPVLALWCRVGLAAKSLSGCSVAVVVRGQLVSVRGQQLVAVRQQLVEVETHLRRRERVPLQQETKYFPDGLTNRYDKHKNCGSFVKNVQIVRNESTPRTLLL